jgi:hypothetical protein
MTKRLITILFLLPLIFAGCGTTQIVCNNADASIYVNGMMKGRGSAQITRMGPPKKVYIEARYNGDIIGSLDIRRSFDWATCCVGYFTYGIGLIFAWRFPETVIIPLKQNSYNKEAVPAGSIWDMPPGEWKKPK